MFAPGRTFFVTSNRRSISMFADSPIFSPFRKTSASVSTPPKTSTARQPAFTSTAGASNVFV